MIEVLKQALHVMESVRVQVTSRERINKPYGEEWYDEAITSLRQAIAEFDSHTLYREGYVNGYAFGEAAGKRQAIANLESQEPVAWLLTDKNINSLEVDSIQRLIDRLKHAHHTDLCVRINGQDEWFQADWLKHMVRAFPPQRIEQEPVAWRTFDGEGQYEYRAYEENESYADEWDKRNPNHKGWVEPLYAHPPQRKPLTDEQAYDLYFDGFSISKLKDFARAIEAVHGIKGES